MTRAAPGATGSRGAAGTDRAAEGLPRWEPDHSWVAGRDPHDTVLELGLRHPDTGPLWAALLAHRGLPADTATVLIGGVAVQRAPDGLRLVSGGEDGVDSLADVADLLVDLADAATAPGAHDAGAGATWVQHPPR